MLRIFVCALAAMPLAALAQTGHEHHQLPAAKAVEKAAPATPKRTDAGSTFSRYQRFTANEPLKDWRAVNDNVRDIGGWRAYSLEASRAIEAEKKATGAKP